MAQSHISIGVSGGVRHVGRALVDVHCAARRLVDLRKMRAKSEYARGLLPALRAGDREVALPHGTQGVEAPAGCAGVVISRHDAGLLGSVGLYYRSSDNGISLPGVTSLVGPAAFGLMSKSKIWVGSHNVAQAFGISTTPLMWPWTGAVPRIE